MKSLDVKIGDQKPSQKSLLEMYTTSINIQNIGVAFPLTLARDLQMSRSGSNDESAVRAFLFSIKSLKFGTQLDENGQASMSGFSFQFVSRCVCVHRLCSSLRSDFPHTPDSGRAILLTSLEKPTKLATG